MFGIAETSERLERRTARRLSFWTRDYLREVALAGFGCAVAVVLNGLFDRRAVGAALIMLAR
jgi:hypothetical protein